MSKSVLRCGDCPLPISLTQLPIVNAAAIPTKADVDDVLGLVQLDEQPRIILLGSDAALAAVLTHLLRQQQLHIEIGFVPAAKSAASRVYGLATGAAAAKTALDGSVEKLPLVRDELGQVLVGGAKTFGAHGEVLTGEAYVDDFQLFSGKVSALIVEPIAQHPGVRARVEKGLGLRRRWAEGRAVQLGTPGAVVTRDGITNHSVVPRSTFYRHEEPWLLVR